MTEAPYPLSTFSEETQKEIMAWHNAESTKAAEEAVRGFAEAVRDIAEDAYKIALQESRNNYGAPEVIAINTVAIFIDRYLAQREKGEV